MPTNTARRMPPDLNERNEWQVRYEDLLERHEDLRRDAADVVRDNKAMRNDPDMAGRPLAGVFQVLLAVLVLGRLAIYEFVQHGGGDAKVIGVLSSVLFCGGAIVLLIAWIRMAWEEMQWLAIVQYVLVFVLILVSVSILDDGALLSGDFHADATHPILAAVIAVAAFLLAASPLALLAVCGVWDALTSMFKKGGS
jgi:hypothetical protein